MPQYQSIRATVADEEATRRAVARLLLVCLMKPVQAPSLLDAIGTAP